jgi:uncharacterized membrane protein (DUF485 family)
MLHKPAIEVGTDHASKKKAQLGVRFFFLYLLFYAGFVAIGVLDYELLGQQVVLGLNLAIFYGMGLIIFAVVLGVIYNNMCSGYEDEMNREEKAS